MASTEIFTLKTFFKMENPKHPKAATLQIRLKHRHRVHQQPLNDAGSPTTYEVSFPDVTSECFAMPPHVLDLPRLRRRCILEALASVQIDKSLSECLWPRLDKFVVEKTQAFGIMGFAVVAEIEVKKIEGLVDETDPSPVLVRQRRNGLDAKGDVCDPRRRCSVVAGLDRKKSA